MAPGRSRCLGAKDRRDLAISSPTSPSRGRGLGNPFTGRTPQEVDAMFRAKGYQPRGPDPTQGLGGYVNPKNGRTYHIDPNNSFGGPPHVDVNRLKTYRGDLDKKKYEL